jgi:glutathione synthase/RimK-type ligase-like ATP-grasp enzyme
MELLIKETLEKLLNIIGISYTGIKIKKEKENVYYTEIETETPACSLVGTAKRSQRFNMF